jgi:hypothetical protein
MFAAAVAKWKSVIVLKLVLSTLVFSAILYVVYFFDNVVVLYCFLNWMLTMY